MKPFTQEASHRPLSRECYPVVLAVPSWIAELRSAVPLCDILLKVEIYQ